MAITDKLRAWYFHRQGLDGRLAGARPAAVLEQTGWARSISGVGPYLTLFARAGVSREAADKAVVKLDIHELPAARGCTYVLPAKDFALGLKVGQSFGEAETKVAAKLGVTAKEIEKLCDAVLKALGKGPLDPQGIREATGNASRSLGEEGKKKGLSTTLPVALGALQARGEIRKIANNGRFDQDRYLYARWDSNPLRGFKLSDEESAIELARRYFQWIGPARLVDFRTFSGFTVKLAKPAVEALKLEPLAPDDDRLMLPADRAAFEAFRVPKEAQYALVSGLDSIILLGQHIGALDQENLKGFDEASYHFVIDRGRAVGVWLYDAPAEAIVWLPFVKKNRELEKAVARTEEFVRTQLGDARGFSLDSVKTRAPRIESLRQKGAA